MTRPADRTAMRIFRDSINPATIPVHGINGVMLYANGRYTATAEQTARFTTAGLQVVRIDVNATAPHLARILDVERGDAGPTQAAQWIPKRDAFRGDATIYVGRTNIPSLFQATECLPNPYWLIVADWTGKAHVCNLGTLPTNVRYAGTQYLSTETYDETCIVNDEWLPKVT